MRCTRRERLPQLTLLIPQRLLQHGEDDGVVQDEVAEVAGTGGAEAGVADQGVFVQQAAGGGGAAGRWESPQHLHDAGDHHGNRQRYADTGGGKWVSERSRCLGYHC